MLSSLFKRQTKSILNSFATKGSSSAFLVTRNDEKFLQRLHKHGSRSFMTNRVNFIKCTINSTNPNSIDTNNNRNNYFSPLTNICKRNIFVQIDKTPNVHSLKFTPTGHQVLPHKMTLNVSNYKEAIKSSDLARELMIIDGVNNVFMTDSFISVSVDDTSKWVDIQGNVVSVINDYLLSKQPILKENFGKSGKDDSGNDENNENEENYDDDDEVVAIIRELIDTRIRPNVQYDGGDVVYRGFDHETGVVKLELVGACKGCASSNVTLYNGIERMLTFYIPEVSGIEEVQSEETKRLQEISQAAFDAVEQMEQQRRENNTANDDNNNSTSTSDQK